MVQFLTEEVKNRWSKVLNAGEKITDAYKKNVTTILLENTQKALREAAPTNMTSNVQNYDPVIISLIRRAAPKLISYDLGATQPMTGPTGLVFAMRARYPAGDGNLSDDVEALFNEADTAWGGKGSTGTIGTAGTYDNATDPSVMNDSSTQDNYTTGTGMSTTELESLGSVGGTEMKEMGFTIEKVVVTAKGRALKATFTTELQQDLKAIHGLDADAELTNILSTELLAEINREFVRTMYVVAKIGAQEAKIQTKGTFDMTVDSDGRWSAEQYKGLKMQVEKEANVIQKDTRRGRGNVIVASPNVVAALSESGRLDYAPAMQTEMNLDVATTTFAGILDGRFKVYSDPYLVGNSADFLVTGYRGTNEYDAGLFYCPYVPLEVYRTQGQDDFQPRIGFKTRYGMIANPFASKNGELSRHGNGYYRKVKVVNL